MMKSQVGVVVGCIIALLLLIAMSITAVLYLKRRRHKLQYANKSLKEQADIESSDTEQRCTNTESDKSSLWSKENTASNHISVDLMPSKIDKEHIDEYYNVGSVARMRTTEHSVFISQLKEYVNSCLADEDFLAEQFKKIPYGLQHSTNSAKKQWNLSKNRYKAMYAYDHSRVVLESLADEKGSDYINANFIQGYLTDNAYIASHGPFSQTLTDFWRMVWEKNVFTIVMLTNLVEKTKTKCIQYWTKVETNALIGDINIQTETEDVFADFTFRRLRISNTNESGEHRTIIHFHYTAWPDKDVLRSPTSLIEFWQRVRQKDETKSYPWLVHCSAGVGRTGTFIALDKLYDQAIDQGFIDVSQCVKDLREQRVNMVQTKNQYIFLHKIMMEILVKWSPPIKSEDFIRVYDDLTKNDENTQKTKLLLQYESLNEEMSAGRKMEDVYEELKEEDEECKDISRPVFPSYTAKSSFILASLDRKTIDMWRLIFDQDVNLIITLPKGNENESEEILPDTETLTIGPFKITLSSTKQEIVYTERCFSLVHHSQERVIKQIIYKQWTSTCPKDPFEMLRFLQDKEQIRGTDRTKPTLIQTLNGVERSGLVIVLVNILERLRFNNEVSIPQVIRHLKSFHDQIIPNYEQFHFCNKVVKCLIESEVTYANA